MPILEMIPDDRLTVFKYEVITCLPQNIFGTKGYLATRQRRLREISIISDPECCLSSSEIRGPFVDLRPYEGLEKLSWKGIGTFKDLIRLMMALRAHHKQLKELTVELSNNQEIVAELADHGRWVQCFYALRQGFSLESLRSLKLANFDLDEHQADCIIRLINWSKLEVLSFRNCIFAQILDPLNSSTVITSNLRRLEVIGMYDRFAVFYFNDWPLLEELCIVTDGEMPNIWADLEKQAPVLKRFIIHRRDAEHSFSGTYFDSKIGRELHKHITNLPFDLDRTLALSNSASTTISHGA